MFFVWCRNLSEMSFSSFLLGTALRVYCLVTRMKKLSRSTKNVEAVITRRAIESYLWRGQEKSIMLEQLPTKCRK